MANCESLHLKQAIFITVVICQNINFVLCPALAFPCDELCLNTVIKLMKHAAHKACLC